MFFFKRMLVEDRNAPADATDRTKAVPLLRAYTVFNGAQIDGIPTFVAPERRELTWERPEAADIILRNSGAVVTFGGDRAFYSPSRDFIQLPEPAAFHSPEAFAATALHEAAHWSGASHRLNRDLTGRFGSAAYGQEELRAELSSCFIGAILNLPATSLTTPITSRVGRPSCARTSARSSAPPPTHSGSRITCSPSISTMPRAWRALSPPTMNQRPIRRRPRDGRLDRLDAHGHRKAP